MPYSINDIDLVILCLGSVFIQFIVKIIKKCIKQPRPSNTVYITYGMPSTRAAMMFFIASYLILIIKPMKMDTKIVLIFSALFSCLIKYFFNEHDIYQLLVGSILGILFALFIYFLKKKNRL